MMACTHEDIRRLASSTVCVFEHANNVTSTLRHIPRELFGPPATCKTMDECPRRSTKYTGRICQDHLKAQTDFHFFQGSSRIVTRPDPPAGSEVLQHITGRVGSGGLQLSRVRSESGWGGPTQPDPTHPTRPDPQGL